MIGGSIGPAIGTGTCPQGAWFYGTAGAKCPLTTRETCNQHDQCGTCLSETRANCAWCAESESCLSQLDDVVECPWGWTPDKCVAKCDKDLLVTATKGFVWLGDDTVGSRLGYAPLTTCKWTISPAVPTQGGYSSRSSNNDLDLTLIFERVDLGKGDSIKVFDAAHKLMSELTNQEYSTDVDKLPLELVTATGAFTVEFTSDAAGEGTGFLATYEATPQGFWDVYIIIAMSTISMLTMVCCFCCWMRCKQEETEAGVAITNNMGMDLQTTERGASLANIRKFPKFCYTPSHVSVMKDIGQSETCTICLGDYEGDEELRLLPCGHCFHAECVDAWLQINRICPMCKVDVYDLYLQQEQKRKVHKKANLKFKKAAKKNRKKEKKANKKLKKSLFGGHGGANIMPLGNGTHCGPGAIPDASKFGNGSMEGTAGTESDTNLTRLEQFRLRSRRLLNVNGAIDESTTVVNIGESKTTTTLPEIEMSVFSTPMETNVQMENPQRTGGRRHNNDVRLFQRPPQFMMAPPPTVTRRATPLRPIRPPMGNMGTAHSQSRPAEGVNVASILQQNLPVARPPNNRRRRSTIHQNDTLLQTRF